MHGNFLCQAFSNVSPEGIVIKVAQNSSLVLERFLTAAAITWSSGLPRVSGQSKPPSCGYIERSKYRPPHLYHCCASTLILGRL